MTKYYLKIRKKISSSLLPEFIWRFHPAAISSRYKFRKYHNIHRRDRCFILGNGPSLKKTDLSLLRDEFTFGLNRIYLLFKEMSFQTTYFVSVNPLVIEQTKDEIIALSMNKFLSWHAREFVHNKNSIIFIRDKYDATEGFAQNPIYRIWEGATVTFVAMQIAFFMGFKEVILIGVDHFFSTKGEPHSLVISEGDDPNHFDPSYFGKGFRWNLPDLETSDRSYHLAKRVYEQNGRRIVDATIGGKLNVFPKVDYGSLFK